MLGVAFLKRTNQHKYSKLMTNIRDQPSIKKDMYPKSIPGAYELLENHSSTKTGDTKKPPYRRGGGCRCGGGRGGRGGRGRIGGMQFAQQTEVISGSDGRTIARIKCFKGNKMGHYSDCCPDAVEGEQMHVDALKIIISNNEDVESNDDNEEEVKMLQEEDNKDDNEAPSGESREEGREVVNEGVGEEDIYRYAWENESWSSNSDNSLVVSL